MRRYIKATHLTSPLREDRRGAEKNNSGREGEAELQSPGRFKGTCVGGYLDFTSRVLSAERHDPRNPDSNTEKLYIMGDVPRDGRTANHSQKFKREKASYRKSKGHAP